MQLAGMGVTQQQAQAGFQNIAQQQAAMQTLAGRYQGYGEAGGVGQTLQTATFGLQGQAQAAAELKRLQTQEASAFGGSAGAAQGSLMGKAQEGAI